MKEPEYVEGGDAISDPDGHRWDYVTGWLEPDEIRDLVRGGAVLAADECAGWRWGIPLDDQAMERVVTAERSHKLARGKYPEAVIMAPTLWRRRGGADALVVLAEEVPKRRKIIAEMREPYRFPFGES